MKVKHNNIQHDVLSDSGPWWPFINCHQILMTTIVIILWLAELPSVDSANSIINNNGNIKNVQQRPLKLAYTFRGNTFPNILQLSLPQPQLLIVNGQFVFTVSTL